VSGSPAPVIASITALAEELSLSTVAEGIEDLDQADVLAQHGVLQGQGWLFGRAVAMADLDLPAPPRQATLPAQRARPGAEVPPA
jgi:sensor c-di-GMP phosphodiesterase-like protein